MEPEIETTYYKTMNDIGLDFLNKIKSLKDCTIYKAGNNKFLQRYCFCSCDPNQMEQICESCAEICHGGKDHVKTEFFEGKIKCQCGMRGHKKIYKTSSFVDLACYYHELSQYSKKNVYYENEKHFVICMYCHNFCLEHLSEKNENTFERIEALGNLTVPDCQCDNKTHKDLKVIFANINNFCWRIHNFEGLLPNQLLNLLFKCKTSFNNVYSNFMSYLDKMKSDLLKKNLYEFDTNINITNFYWSLRNFSEISKHNKNHAYFSDKIANLFDYSFVCNILSIKLEDQKHFWNCLNMIIICFRKITLGNALHNFPTVNFEDYENMNPFQRLMLASRVRQNKEFNDQFITGKRNLIEIIMNVIEQVLIIRFVNIEALKLLKNLFKILKTFAKFFLFSSKQVLRYSFLINQLFVRLKDFKMESETHSIRIRKHDTHIISNVVKTLIYLSFNFNDKTVFKTLNTKFTSKNVKPQFYNFYYTNNETGKAISKNCLDILHFIKEELFLSQNETLNMQRNNKNIQLQVLFIEEYEELNDADQEEFLDPDEVIMESEKIPCLKKSIDKKLTVLITLATKLMNFSIGGTDSYIVGLRRCMTKNIEYYLKIIKNVFTSREEEFLYEINNITKNMENSYFMFINFDCSENSLIDVVITSINDCFQKIYLDIEEPTSIFDGASPARKATTSHALPTRASNLQKHNDPPPLKLNSQLSDHLSHEKIRILLNKTNFVYSVMKVLKFINPKKNLDSKLYGKIIKLILIFIEDNPDNAILMLNKEFIQLLTMFPVLLCDKAFELILKITRNLIIAKVEIVNLSVCINLLMHYFLLVKVTLF